MWLEEWAAPRRAGGAAASEEWPQAAFLSFFSILIPATATVPVQPVTQALQLLR